VGGLCSVFGQLGSYGPGLVGGMRWKGVWVPVSGIGEAVGS
jgi:hypothetical protein